MRTSADRDRKHRRSAPPGLRPAAYVAFAVALSAGGCSGAPRDALPAPQTTTSDINQDIDATLPNDAFGLRPVLPGNRIPPPRGDPVPGR